VHRVAAEEGHVDDQPFERQRGKWADHAMALRRHGAAEQHDLQPRRAREEQRDLGTARHHREPVAAVEVFREPDAGGPGVEEDRAALGEQVCGAGPDRGLGNGFETQPLTELALVENRAREGAAVGPGHRALPGQPGQVAPHRRRRDGEGRRELVDVGGAGAQQGQQPLVPGTGAAA
jgi:hypothetical protein